MGFDAEWGVVSAADTGAPHLRERIWIVAHAMRFGQFRSAGIEIGSHNGQRIAEAHWQVGRTVTDARQPGGEDVADTYGAERKARSGNGMGNAEPSQSPSCFGGDKELADAGCLDEQRELPGIADAQEWRDPGERQAGSRGNGIGWWAVEPELGRVAHGLANRVDRLKAIGNGQVSAVAATAWKILTKEAA
jgi:DNA (cytosine-5)-methyltransferase 1